MIFWDLDGPILDVSEKYYSVYKDILLEKNATTLTKDVFWKLKRSRVSIEEILTRSNSQSLVELYKKLWFDRIETLKYLEKDSLQPGVIDVLKQCKQKNNLVMVTLRQRREKLLTQLKQLNLTQYFDDILDSGDDIKPRWKIKYNLIKDYLNDNDGKVHTIIGDTETDILAGNNLGFISIAVLCGIRNEELLKAKPTKYFYKSHELMEIFT
ncbi:HAD family hydrolase [candidate division KSB1 bacterium]|nr:HAD family hydrolase [candidate division KSB1 bacterium]MBL7105572.1 HAD family hydrolase [Bacteroidales bacterium]